MNTLLKKTNNTAFDNLLRSHFGRPAESASVCPEFDADLANAYVEQGLAGAERARYEQHLSGCFGCRTSVVALSRMAAADLSASPVPEAARNPEPGEPGWLASLKRGLGLMASPRWAVALTALLVIAISVPLLATRNRRPGIASQADQAATAPSASEPAIAVSDSAIPRAAPSPQGQRNAQPIAAAGRSLDSEQARRENLSSGLLKKTDEATSVVAGTQAPADAVERKSGGESGELAGVRDDARLKENNEKTLASAASAPPAPQPKVEESRESTKIPKASALRLPEDSRSAKVETLKPGVPDAGPKTERDKDTITAIRSTDGDAPKHKAALEPESHSRLAAGARGRALVAESARLDRARSPEKTVGKKTFWLSRGVWTDSEYNSDRKLPMVTVVRDSDVYKELLEKNNKLTVFFKGFNETERAIIVFKNTVYTLIPQSDNK
jgi:hypothetical protein